MTPASIPESLFELPIEERITLADRLYASVPGDWQGWADREALAEAERRADEMDADPSCGLTEEQFLAKVAELRAAR